jgi:uncharacterized protein
MLPMIVQRRSEIADLCRRLGVRRLDVFGSAAREADFDPERSDIDFLVEFENPASVSFQLYFQLKEGLEQLLGRTVDLVTESAVKNPYLRASIAAGRRPLYAA